MVSGDERLEKECFKKLVLTRSTSDTAAWSVVLHFEVCRHSYTSFLEASSSSIKYRKRPSQGGVGYVRFCFPAGDQGLYPVCKHIDFKHCCLNLHKLSCFLNLTK